MSLLGEIILVGPDSMPFSGVNTNVTASIPVAGASGVPQGPYPLGTQLVFKDGRKFRYASVGATSLAVGDVQQAAANVTTDLAMSSTVSTSINPYNGKATDHAVGGTAIGFTHGAATTIANFFAEGFVVLTVAPGGGDYYKIASHVALSSGAATPIDVVNLWPGHSIRTALVNTATHVSLFQHPYSRVIQSPVTTPTNVIVGVSPIALTGASGRGNFGWLATRGPCAVMTSGTVVIGATVTGTGARNGGAANQLVTKTGSTQAIENNIGVVMRVSADGAWSWIFLQIDG